MARALSRSANRLSRETLDHPRTPIPLHPTTPTAHTPRSRADTTQFAACAQPLHTGNSASPTDAVRGDVCDVNVVCDDQLLSGVGGSKT